MLRAIHHATETKSNIIYDIPNLFWLTVAGRQLQDGRERRDPLDAAVPLAAHTHDPGDGAFRESNFQENAQIAKPPSASAVPTHPVEGRP